MRKISLFMLLAVILFAACNNPSFKKGKDGLEYKIISKGSGAKIQYGDYMQLNFATFYNNGKTDSMLNDSRKQGMPVIELLDSVSTPPAYFEILRQLKKGDSVVIRILSDSAFKKAPEQMPPFIKKGHYIITTLKITGIYKTKAEADVARTAAVAEMQKRDSINAIGQIATDEKLIKDYLSKNNIKATRAPLGTYVEIIQPGTGPNIDTSVVAKVNYTGKTINGKVPFDSNTDPAKGPSQPLPVNMTTDPSLGNPLIKGFYDGMPLLNKGAKARLYIPSSLGYGAQGMGADIPANSVLIFDIEVLDVLSRAQAKADVEAKQKQMQEMQKHYMDSINNSRKAAEAPQK